jgi:translation initiation factor IF-3
MNRLAEEVADYGVVEQAPKIEGGSMTMVLAPNKQSRAAGGSGRQQQEEEE